jgi:hypothetical protein
MGSRVSVLQYEHRDDMKFNWRAERPREGAPFSFVEIELPGEDVDALRAEVGEVVDIVNDIVARDPLNAMVRADPGLVEVLVS